MGPMNMGRGVFSSFLPPHPLPLPLNRGRPQGAAGKVTLPRGELAILVVVGVHLQPQQEVVELRHKGPGGEDVAESIGQP